MRKGLARGNAGNEAGSTRGGNRDGRRGSSVPLPEKVDAEEAMADMVTLGA